MPAGEPGAKQYLCYEAATGTVLQFIVETHDHAGPDQMDDALRGITDAVRERGASMTNVEHQPLSIPIAGRSYRFTSDLTVQGRSLHQHGYLVFAGNIYALQATATDASEPAPLRRFAESFRLLREVPSPAEERAELQGRAAADCCFWVLVAVAIVAGLRRLARSSPPPPVAPSPPTGLAPAPEP